MTISPRDQIKRYAACQKYTLPEQLTGGNRPVTDVLLESSVEGRCSHCQGAIYRGSPVRAVTFMPTGGSMFNLAFCVHCLEAQLDSVFFAEINAGPDAPRDPFLERKDLHAGPPHVTAIDYLGLIEPAKLQSDNDLSDAYHRLRYLTSGKGN